MIDRQKLRELILAEPEGISVEAGGMISLNNPPDLTKPEIREAFEAGMTLGVQLGRMNPLK